MKYLTVETGANLENCHIIFKEKDCVIVDPGDDGEKICQAITKNQLNPQAVLLTHTHYDHIGACGEIAERYNIPVYVSLSDFKRITTSRASVYYSKSEIKSERAIFICDGDELALGDIKIKVLATPGHTEGSVCYFIEDLMITGDTLFYQSMGRVDLEGGSLEEMKNTLIHKIATIKDDYIVLSGHGENTSLQYEIKENYYIQYFLKELK